MPKVLRIINRLNLGGPTFNASLLTKHLAPEFETLLVAGIKQDSEESSDFIVKEMGLTFISLTQMERSINPFKDYKAYKEIRRIIREFKPDIVHTHAAKAGALGRLAAVHEKVPVIVHTFHGHVFHSYFHPLKTQFFLRIERFLARHSSAIVAISDRQRKELVEQYKICDPAKLVVIPLGFDLSRFRENTPEKRTFFRNKFSIQDDEIAIGIIGRLVPIKNHSLFLMAAERILKETQRKVRFLIIGDGESRDELLKEAAGLKLDFNYFPSDPRPSKVTFCSWMKDVDVAMAGLDIVALTSFNEGTPVSLIEAQAAGKPIVSTNVGGIENVVKPGDTALLTESDNLEQFTKALLNLIEDDELRNRISHTGWEYVKEKYHYTRLVKEMSELYHKLLKQAYSKH